MHSKDKIVEKLLKISDFKPTGTNYEETKSMKVRKGELDNGKVTHDQSVVQEAKRRETIHS